jgi:hypothetical protein
MSLDDFVKNCLNDNLFKPLGIENLNKSLSENNSHYENDKWLVQIIENNNNNQNIFTSITNINNVVKSSSDIFAKEYFSIRIDQNKLSANLIDQSIKFNFTEDIKSELKNCLNKNWIFVFKKGVKVDLNSSPYFTDTNNVRLYINFIIDLTIRLCLWSKTNQICMTVDYELLNYENESLFIIPNYNKINRFEATIDNKDNVLKSFNNIVDLIKKLHRSNLNLRLRLLIENLIYFQNYIAGTDNYQTLKMYFDEKEFIYRDKILTEFLSIFMFEEKNLEEKFNNRHNNGEDMRTSCLLLLLFICYSFDVFNKTTKLVLVISTKESKEIPLGTLEKEKKTIFSWENTVDSLPKKEEKSQSDQESSKPSFDEVSTQDLIITRNNGKPHVEPHSKPHVEPHSKPYGKPHGKPHGKPSTSQSIENPKKEFDTLTDISTEDPQDILSKKVPDKQTTYTIDEIIKQVGIFSIKIGGENLMSISNTNVFKPNDTQYYKFSGKDKEWFVCETKIKNFMLSAFDELYTSGVFGSNIMNIYYKIIIHTKDTPSKKKSIIMNRSYDQKKFSFSDNKVELNQKIEPVDLNFFNSYFIINSYTGSEVKKFYDVSSNLKESFVIDFLIKYLNLVADYISNNDKWIFYFYNQDDIKVYGDNIFIAPNYANLSSSKIINLKSNTILAIVNIQSLFTLFSSYFKSKNINIFTTLLFLLNTLSYIDPSNISKEKKFDFSTQGLIKNIMNKSEFLKLREDYIQSQQLIDLVKLYIKLILDILTTIRSNPKSEDPALKIFTPSADCDEWKADLEAIKKELEKAAQDLQLARTVLDAAKK